MIVDGPQTRDRGHYTALATVGQQLKSNSIQSYALGIGPNVRDQDLKDIASNPKNVYKSTVNALPNARIRIGDTWLKYLRGILYNEM